MFPSSVDNCKFGAMFDSFLGPLRLYSGKVGHLLTVRVLLLLNEFPPSKLRSNEIITLFPLCRATCH